MNGPRVVLGVLAALYGLFTFYVRATSPEKLRKLAAMKQAWGETGGTIVHVIGYSVVPLLVGVGMIVTGLSGS